MSRVERLAECRLRRSANQPDGATKSPGSLERRADSAHLPFDLVPASRLPITVAPMPSPRSASVAGSGTVITCCACSAACEGSCDGPPCRPRCAESIDPDRRTDAATTAMVTTVRIYCSPLSDLSTTTTPRGSVYISLKGLGSAQQELAIACNTAVRQEQSPDASTVFARIRALRTYSDEMPSGERGSRGIGEGVR